MNNEELTKSLRSSLSVKFDTVLFPFDIQQFLGILSDAGYIVEDGLDNTPVLGARVAARGIVGRLGDIGIRVQSERLILGIVTKSYSVLFPEMDKVEKIIAKNFGTKVSEIAQYYEFLTHFTVRTKQNPLDDWTSHFQNVEIINRLSEVLGSEVIPFGLRLAKKAVRPNQVNWFEIRIEPHVPSSTTHHLFEIVFRNSSRQDVKRFIDSLETTISSIISTIETQ